MSQLNETQRTMVQQLNGLNPLWRAEFGVRGLIVMDENTLRIPIRVGRKKVNFDLTYDSGEDLYNVKAYKVSDFTKELLRSGVWTEATKAITVLEGKGFFWDQLNDLMKQATEK